MCNYRTPLSYSFLTPLGRQFVYYIRQGGYVIVVVCLSVRPLATLHKNFLMVLHDIFREGWHCANEQMIKFRWRSGSRIRIRIRMRIATLVRRVLVEVCTVPVLLGINCAETSYPVNVLRLGTDYPRSRAVKTVVQ